MLTIDRACLIEGVVGGNRVVRFVCRGETIRTSMAIGIRSMRAAGEAVIDTGAETACRGVFAASGRLMAEFAALCTQGNVKPVFNWAESYADL